MQTVVDIRTMTAGDLPAVLEIQAICYTEVTPESKESLHAKLSASQSTCLIASFEGNTVGYLIALPWEFSNPPALNAKACELPSSPSCLYLHDLAVTPGRKKGRRRARLGRSVFDSTEAHRPWTRQPGCRARLRALLGAPRFSRRDAIGATEGQAFHLREGRSVHGTSQLATRRGALTGAADATPSSAAGSATAPESAPRHRPCSTRT